MKKTLQEIGQVRVIDRPERIEPTFTDDTSGVRLSRNARRLMDAGEKILFDPPERTDFLHTVMCQVGMPRRSTLERTFQRTSGHVSVQLEAGSLWNGTEWIQQPLPYLL